MASPEVTGVSTNGVGVANDMSLYPLIMDYQSRVAQLDSAYASGGYVPRDTVQVQPTYNYGNLWEQMAENQDRWMNNAISQNQRYNRMNVEINGPKYTVTEAADVLRDKVLQNEQDQIQEALLAYKQALKDMYYPAKDVDDRELTALAKSQYRQRFGTRLEDDIRNNASTSFWNGFIRTGTFGLFGDKISAEENIAQITGQPASSKAKTWKKTGNALGGLAAGAATGALVGSIIPVLGTGIGAVVGGVIGLVSGLFKR